MTLGTKYLSHFIITPRPMPPLRAPGASRVKSAYHGSRVFDPVCCAYALYNAVLCYGPFVLLGWASKRYLDRWTATNLGKRPLGSPRHVGLGAPSATLPTRCLVQVGAIEPRFRFSPASRPIVVREQKGDEQQSSLNDCNAYPEGAPPWPVVHNGEGEHRDETGDD
jgi:hypothetical protein